MSLRKRIIISASLVLAVFISLTVMALDRAFIDSTESALHDKLVSQVYALMAAADITDNSIQMPSNQLDALLGLPASGMYAFITDAHNTVLWKSASALNATPPRPLSLAKGQHLFKRISHNHNNYYLYAYGVNWITQQQPLALTFNIITDTKSFTRQINHYRKTLWSWLLAMAVLLLVSQAIILRWGLSPLMQVSDELSAIESGKQQHIIQQYPQEIKRLSNKINSLLKHEREQKTRYRNALGDLAHSLKTPLAILQNSINDMSIEQIENSRQQISRMNTIIEYQLQRAATSGATGSSKNVNLEKAVTRITDALQKVYRDKNIHVDIQVDKALFFYGDEEDLMELLGNLLDNAFKWARHNVDIQARQNTQDQNLVIHISDDGPGIKSAQINSILQRGIRADQCTAGQGIGLSIVKDIVDAYNGRLIIEKSQPGGARIIITLPLLSH